ncbi:hypothetical protein [Corynebacterium diphtheriae]|uniref:hypothetical protein n=1 Tax=Corynebacterium diphtheriae TaxID=1717 RepID=UPI0013C5CC56|nr:hypothetical protein [Corynebacterium diphtheriae]MBG9256682.1 hypothetical protein [Corynebacterium diphtheriae bv. mitis]MBG9291116.1 hypothetical protein [Corynebacterium diphtheriae bv. gravis]CAB0810778.1 hypothetical protein FRC0192_01831 [Corynebacterium diphtheriae]
MSVSINMGGSFLSTDPSEHDTHSIAIDGVTIEWGTEKFLDEYRPMVAKFDVILPRDPRGMSAVIRSGDIFSEDVMIYDGSTIIFRGKIRKIRPWLHSKKNDDRQWRMTLTCTDATTDLTMYPKGVFDKGWLETPLASALSQLEGFVKDPTHVQSLIPPKGGQSTNVRVSSPDENPRQARTWLQLLYSSYAGFSYSYDPTTASIRVRPNPAAVVEWGLTKYVGGLAPAHIGYTVLDGDAVESAKTIDIEADDLSVDVIGCEITPVHTVGRIIVESYRRDKTDPVKEQFTFPGWGKSQITVHSVASSASKDIATRVFETYRTVQREPAHPDITYHLPDTEKDADTRTWWLRTFADARIARVESSELAWWLAGEGSEPDLISPIGGTMRYRGGKGWDITLHVIFASRDTLPPAKIRELGEVKYYDLHPDVTLAELGKLTTKKD